MQANPVKEIAFAAGENIFLNARYPGRRPWRRLGVLNESNALHQQLPRVTALITLYEHIQRISRETTQLQANVAKKRKARGGGRGFGDMLQSL
jgi:hypothetical protein